MKNHFYLVFICLIIFSCSSKKDGKEKVEEKKTASPLIGEWENLSMIIRMEDSILNVPEGQWQEVMGFRPITTVYSENGTYVSEYKTLADSVFMSSSGTWRANNDSLIMIEHGVENRYYYRVFGDTVVFRAFLDWDQDGLKNDHYASKQIKISE